MVIAESQMNGRGQYGRKWISQKGNLFVSFFNELNKRNLPINYITKINCLLVKKLLSKFTSKKKLLRNKNIIPSKKLLIIREQGVGDEILYGTIYEDLLIFFLVISCKFVVG